MGLLEIVSGASCTKPLLVKLWLITCRRPGRLRCPPSRSQVPVTEHEYAIMKMLGMVSYWTFFHENLSEFTSGVFLATVKVGSIYVDFSSYNYDTQMMMISKLFTIEKMKIWKIMLNFSKNSKIKIKKSKKTQKIKKIQNNKTVKIWKICLKIFTVLGFENFWFLIFFWIFGFYFEIFWKIQHDFSNFHFFDCK